MNANFNSALALRCQYIKARNIVTKPKKEKKEEIKRDSEPKQKKSNTKQTTRK